MQHGEQAASPTTAMAPAPDLPPFAAIVVAAGQGLRAGGAVPKQFRLWHGKPVVRHSAEALLAAGANPLVVAIPADGSEQAEQALAELEGVKLVSGGATRQASVRLALEAMAEDSPALVLIHDAARPTLPRAVIERLLGALSHTPGRSRSCRWLTACRSTKTG